MKLSYRGVNYETDPTTIEVTEGDVGGLYRGHTWKLHLPKRRPRHQPPAELLYRGAHYKRQ